LRQLGPVDQDEQTQQAAVPLDKAKQRLDWI
jgi:hypothetical protein